MQGRSRNLGRLLAFALLGLGTVALVIGGCQKPAPQAGDPEAIKTAITADEKKWSDEFQAKPQDLEALIAHYSEDADFVAPGSKLTGLRRVMAAVAGDEAKEPPKVAPLQFILSEGSQ